MTTTLFPPLPAPCQAQYTDVMIDLELLGLELGRPIIQIGLCFFDLHHPNPMAAAGVVRLSVCPDVAHEACQETLDWWKETNPALFEELVARSRHSEAAAAVFEQLRQELLERCPMRVWADYTQFDIAQLALAMQREGVRVPWSHRQVQSSATIHRACADLGLELPDVPVHAGRLEHEAGSDAYHQAAELCAWFATLRRATEKQAA